MRREPISEQERRSAWLAFASAAAAGLVRPNEDGEVMDANDVCDAASEIADMMLEDFDKRFGAKKSRLKRKEEEEE